MNNYSYLIIENSIDVCKGIINRMSGFDQWVSIGYEINVIQAISKIKRELPQLIFLDWSLQGGSAFEVLDEIKKINNYQPYIIFFTGFQYDEPTIPERIFNQYNVDVYLLKPIWEKFRNNLEGYLTAAERKFIKQEAERTKSNVHLKNLTIVDNYKQKHLVPISDILIIKVSDTNSRIKEIIQKGKLRPISTRMTWLELENLLETLEDEFFRTHLRTHLINKRYISHYNRDWVYILGYQDAVPLSRERYLAFVEWMEGQAGSTVKDK